MNWRRYSVKAIGCICGAIIFVMIVVLLVYSNCRVILERMVIIPEYSICSITYEYYIRSADNSNIPDSWVINRKRVNVNQEDSEELYNLLNQAPITWSLLESEDYLKYVKQVEFETKYGVKYRVWNDADNIWYLGKGFICVELTESEKGELLQIIRKYIDYEHEIEVLAG